MKSLNGFLKSLETLNDDVFSRIDRFGGLNLQDLTGFVKNPVDFSVVPDHPNNSVIVDYASLSKDLETKGEQALTSGETAVVIYSSDHNDVSCTSEIIAGMNMLNAKHIQIPNMQNVWYVLPAAQYESCKSFLSCLSHTENIKIFRQFESIRLAPDNTPIVKGNNLHSCGTGDAFACLLENDTLTNFLSSAGKYLYFIDLANFLAFPDPLTLGYHIHTSSFITYEVTKRCETDVKKPFLCNVAGSQQIVESFKAPYSKEDFEWVGTGSFVINANLDFHNLKLPWHRIKRKVNNELVIQYERFLNDITMFYDTSYVAVDRQEKYLPLNTNEDICRLKQAIEFK